MASGQKDYITWSHGDFNNYARGCLKHSFIAFQGLCEQFIIIKGRQTICSFHFYLYFCISFVFFILKKNKTERNFSTSKRYLEIYICEDDIRSNPWIINYKI